ncbi:glycosyl hydrolase family 61-domain-containing protein, partial [Mycena crocata]
MITTATFFQLLLLTSYASAHGFVSRITINGADGPVFKGNTPNDKPKASIIRQISTTSPVKGAQNAALSCGPDAPPASSFARVQPGDTMSFFWLSGDTEAKFWPHDTGPIITYLARCNDDSNCTRFDSSEAKWFKIQQDGRIDKDGDWAQTDVPSNATLPPTLAPGPYLVRHEIIGLHLAEKPFKNIKSSDGAEFYPSCAQIIVEGNEKGEPTDGDLVVFPGAYTDTEPGILLNPFDNDGEYPFPGPSVAKLVTPSSPSESSAPSSTTDSSSEEPATTSTGTSSSESSSPSSTTDSSSEEPATTSTGKPAGKS